MFTTRPIGCWTILVLLLLLPAAQGWSGTPERVRANAPVRQADFPSAPRAHDAELGIFGGIFVPSESHELYDSTQSFQSPYNAFGPKVGLRLGYFPLAFLGGEIEGGYSPIDNLRGERHHLYDVRGHAVVQLPWRLTPFLVAGGGVLGVDGPRGGDIDAALHWGGGVKFLANEWLDFRLDGRHIISGAAGPGTGNTSHFEVTAGVGVLLYRADPAPSFVQRPEPAPETEPAPPVVAEVAPEPERAPPELEPVVLERTLYVESMAPVEFAFDSAAIPSSFRMELMEIAGLMKTRPDLDVLVVGHADAVGAEAYNQRLSERRAEAVAAYLEGRGIARDRIRTRGEGESSPIASNETEAGRARNRRTELTVVERRSAATGASEARDEPRPEAPIRRGPNERALRRDDS